MSPSDSSWSLFKSNSNQEGSITLSYTKPLMAADYFLLCWKREGKENEYIQAGGFDSGEIRQLIDKLLEHLNVECLLQALAVVQGDKAVSAAQYLSEFVRSRRQ